MSQLLCPDCEAPVDDEGDALDDRSSECPMNGCWSHASDCSTCGTVDCDRSC